MTAITTTGLTKAYKRYEKAPGLLGSLRSLVVRPYTTHDALVDFDVSVDEGEFVGLIGPNGAGKTTLIKLLTGIIAPSGGRADVLGFTPSRLQDGLKRQYALVVGQKSQLFPELSAADAFLLFRQIYGIGDADFRRNRDALVDLFGVSKLLHVPVRTLSLGERMKMELVAALLHQPRLLFLDEPTIGLDAVAQGQMRAFLAEVNRMRGTTILLTSHYMEDIRVLCKRCVVLGAGRKCYDGDLHDLLARHSDLRRITVELADAHGAALPACAQRVVRGEGRLTFYAPREEAHRAARELLMTLEVRSIAVEDEDIADVVGRIYAARAEAAL